MPLKTLEEHNREARERRERARCPQPTGIACPCCGDELVDPTPGVVLPTAPLQKRVMCRTCNYKGTMVL